MKSPFPGMDPYLEARWPDVHTKLIAFIGEAIQASLPSGLRARSEERVLLEEASHGMRGYRSDIAIVESGHEGRMPPAGVTGALAIADPITVEFPDTPPIERFVQIIDRTNGNRVVTAIEVLSPWNKGPGRLNKDYLRKLDRNGEVSVVEIDLLRSSRGRLPFEQADLAPERRQPYVVGVRRAWRPQIWDVYSMSLRQPLPGFQVPLRRSDADVILYLQPLIERVYTAGGHDDIDYSKPPEPPLTPDDAAWANEMLRGAGRV